MARVEVSPQTAGVGRMEKCCFLGKGCRKGETLPLRQGPPLQ